MARNRQRAKQRQAERRARRIEQQKGDGQRRAEAQPDVEPGPSARARRPGSRSPTRSSCPEPVPSRSRTVDLEEDEDVDPELAYDAEEAGALESVDEGYAPRGRRGDEAPYELGGEATGRERGRFVQFLIHVWAELQRVQWPDRQALTTLTGVVLGFVLIAGGYLGLLDAIFSRLIQAIL